MVEGTGNGTEVDRRLVDLASDPIRVEMLRMLSERVGGATEIAEELGVSAVEIADRLEGMLEVGLIEVAEGEPGQAEPCYQALVRALWSDKEWSALNREERTELSRWIAQLIGSDLDEALDAGSFGARHDTHASRTVLVVDQQGWRALTRIQDEALEEIFAVQAESAERLGESGQKRGSPVMAAMLCFEMPARGEESS